MSSPVQPPLTVETIDGATVGRPITKIKVTNGTLAVAGSTATLTISGGGGGSGTVTSVGLTETGSALTITGSPITTSGTINIAGAGTSSQVILGDLSLGTLTSGTVTGTGAANQVSYWTAASVQAGSTGLTYNPSTGDLTVGGYVEVGTKITTPTGTDLTLDTVGGTDSGSIIIGDGVNGQLSISANGTGAIKLGAANNPVTVSNVYTLPTVVTTDNGYVLTAQTDGSTAWAASGGGGVTFPLEADSGSLSNPSYSFSGDTNTGMYSSTADNINLVTGGSIRATINSNGLSLGDNTDVGKISSLGTNNLLLQTNNGTNSGKIEITDGAGEDIDLVPNGAGSVRLGDATGSFLSSKTVIVSDLNSTAVDISSKTSVTNAPQTVLQLINGTTSTAAAGSGAKIQFRNGDSNFAGFTAGTIHTEQIDTSNHNMFITPQGTGKVKLGTLPFKADQTVGAGQDNYILTYDNSSDSISLEASAGGGNEFNAELVGVELDAAGTGYNVFDILSAPPYGVARYTTGSVDAKQYFYPFIAPATGDLSELIVNITSAAGSATNLYYGFYRDNNGVPSTVLGYATVDATSTGNISVTSFSGTISLTRGNQFWVSQNKSTSQSITQRSIQNDYLPRIAPSSSFPSTTNGYSASLASNSSVTAVPADVTAEGLEGGVYFAGLGAKPHIGVKIT